MLSHLKIVINPENKIEFKCIPLSFLYSFLCSFKPKKDNKSMRIRRKESVTNFIISQCSISKTSSTKAKKNSFFFFFFFLKARFLVTSGSLGRTSRVYLSLSLAFPIGYQIKKNKTSLTVILSSSTSLIGKLLNKTKSDCKSFLTRKLNW